MAKKKKVQKKKQVVKKKAAARSVKHELVVRVDATPIMPTVSDLTEPITGAGNKLTIPKTWISAPQLIRMTEKTPPSQIYKRPGKGSGEWDYVTVSYVQRVLDYVFGFNWDFEIIEHGKEVDHVWVLGKLIVRSPDGSHAITKTQFGRSEVKYKKGTKDLLDYGNDLKAASSDALKKCASMLGIARDIYGKGDYKAESGKDPLPPATPQTPKQTIKDTQMKYEKVDVVLKAGQKIGPDGEATYVCAIDGDPISEQVANYSLNAYGRRLCREHQVGPKRKK